MCINYHSECDPSPFPSKFKRTKQGYNAEPVYYGIYIYKNKNTDLIWKLVEQQPIMTVEDDLPWSADQKNVQQAIAIYVILSSTTEQNTGMEIFSLKT